jgi:hypothetical protein
LCDSGVQGEHEKEHEAKVDSPEDGTPSRFHPPSPRSCLVTNAIHNLSERSKHPNLSAVFRGHVVTMLTFLRLYGADNGVSWHEASLLAATVAGKGNGIVHSLREWVWEYFEDNKQLPVSLYGQH